jgi:hypothetical protein
MEIRMRNTGQLMTSQEFNRVVCSLPITAEVLNQHGADPVFEGPQATGGTRYQFSMRDGVTNIEGKWYTFYKLGPVFTDRAATETEPAMTAAEQETAYKAMKDAEQAKSARQSRDQMLKDSDWTQIADSTADKVAWATYRQALRDVPAQSGFPWDITWPDAP